MRDLTIGKNEAGQRMDKYLKKYFPEAGSGFLYKMLRKKNILLNEKKADGKEMLKPGDRIRLYLAEETIEKFRGEQMKPAVSGRKTPDIKLEVIYEDDHVAIVNKPAGMLSQKAKPSDLSLVEYFQRYLLETGAITYSRHRKIMEDIRKGRPLKPLSQKKAESQRMTVEQMEKRALILSKKLRKEPGKIMEQLISQEQQRRKMTPLEKKAAKEIVKRLQEDRPLNREERRAGKRNCAGAKNAGDSKNTE